MVAVARDHKPLVALWLQIVLTHQTADRAAMARLGTNPPVKNEWSVNS